MFSSVVTASILGLDVECSRAEVNVASGLPKFLIVGLADQAVKEASDRIRAAVVNCGFEFPDRRVTVNLTPAGRSKNGSHYDLPIAIGLLLACGQLTACRSLEDTAFIGELSLDGSVNPVDGILPMIIGLQKLGIERVMLPQGNIGEAGLLRGVELYPVSSLAQAAGHVNGDSPVRPAAHAAGGAGAARAQVPDFSEILGQESVKRAAQVAAAGMHGMLMIGPPGVGKSMVGKRIPGILPPMTYKEQMDVTQIYSIAGELSPERPVISERPYRAPHHSMSAAALIGGGRVPHPGEISLAHCGVLFLDELPEFSSHTIDMLRTPMEEGRVMINRAEWRCSFPSQFMLVAAMNPCRCGYYGDPVRKCTCTETDRQRYIGRISGPLLDRIDIHVSMERVVYGDMSGSARKPGLSTAELREAVVSASKLQAQRYKNCGIDRNSQLTPALIKRFCVLESDASDIIRGAFESLSLSARSYHRILKVARTVADIGGSERIRSADILEALSYRCPERFFK